MACLPIGKYVAYKQSCVERLLISYIRNGESKYYQEPVDLCNVDGEPQNLACFILKFFPYHPKENKEKTMSGNERYFS